MLLNQFLIFVFNFIFFIFLLSIMTIFGFCALFWVLCAARKAENFKIFN